MIQQAQGSVFADVEQMALSMMFEPNKEHHGNVHFIMKTADIFKSMGYVDVNQYQDKINDLKIYSKYDYYVTANTTKTNERTIENLFSYNNIVIDIDCHETTELYIIQQLLDELLYRLERDLFNTLELPEPNIIVKTGRGVQLWYCINQIPSQMSWLYDMGRKAIIQGISDVLEEYTYLNDLKIDMVASGNDVGIFRLPGSWNTKVNKRVETTILSPFKYNVNDLACYFKPIEAPQRTKTKKARELSHKRLNVLETIYEARRGQREGSRDTLMFLYYNNLVQCYSCEYADKKLNELNDGFRFPLKERELSNIKKYIDSKGFLKFKEQTFKDWLGMSEEEKKMINLRMTKEEQRKQKRLEKKKNQETVKKLALNGLSIIEISKQTNLHRNTVKLILKDIDFKTLRNNRIKELKEQGMTKKEIATLMNVSVETVKRVSR